MLRFPGFPFADTLYSLAIHCDESQYTKVASAFLKWLKKELSHLKPIWVLVGPGSEEVLGSIFGWKTFTCAAEERVDATKSVGSHNHDVARKIRHAEKEV